MSKKDVYIERISQQLSYWKSEIKILELKAEIAAEDIKEQGKEKLDALQQFYESTEGKMEEWIAASGEAWEAIEEIAEQQLDAADAAMKDSLDHIKTIFNTDDAPKN